MRTGCLSSALLLVCLSCTDRATESRSVAGRSPASTTSAGSGTPQIAGSSVEGGRTRVELQVPNGRHITIALTRDSTVGSETPPNRVTILGEIRDVVVVLIDTYASQSGGMSYCQAGEEQFLRVVPLAHRDVRDFATIKVASCRENLELADDGIQWDLPSRSIRVHWLAGPNGKPEVRNIRIGPDGRLQNQS